MLNTITVSKILEVTFILVIVLITSCKTDVKEKILSEDELINSELNKGIRKDTVFLGYIFGMSYEQAKKHTEKLYKDGTPLSQSSLGMFDKVGVYTLFDSLKVYIEFKPYFYEDKLYKIEAVTEIGYLDEDFKRKFGEIVNIYKTKYGKPTLIESHHTGLEIFTWLDGNRKIKIEPSPYLGDLSLNDLIDLTNKSKNNSSNEYEISVLYEDVSLTTLMKKREKQNEDSIKKIIKEKSKDII